MQVEQVKKRADDGVQGSSKVPLYRQISDALLAGIREGKFPVGTFLPGELELIDRFDASRHTIREALRVLEDMAGLRAEEAAPDYRAPETTSNG